MTTRIEAFNPNLNLLEVLLWEYNEATGLQSIIEQKQAWYEENQVKFWQDWYTNVFNLETANEFGLSVWARILDVPLTFTTPASDPSKIGWAFGPLRKNFNNGNFKQADSGTGLLTTEQKRIVLQLRYFQLTTNADLLSVNQFLSYLFLENYGLVYVRDNYDMTISYVFTFYPPSQLQQVLENFDILPRPTGVKANIELALESFFGFENHANFDNGNFSPGGV
jgi:hypothetical protein